MYIAVTSTIGISIMLWALYEMYTFYKDMRNL